eukprot:GHVL01013098.1.p1 GENE.GHVL01013098.1~~GHVL01013098.1.p1  ORF type:complete len:282 (-),score=26.30 GHVL01013098.1:777-1622(-)
MNRNIHTTRTGGFAMLTKAFPDASSSQLFSEENCQIRRARSDPEEIRNLLPGGVVRTCLRCGQRPIDEQGFMDGVPGLPQPLCRRCKRFQILRIGWPLYKYRYKIHTVTPNRRIKILSLTADLRSFVYKHWFNNKEKHVKLSTIIGIIFGACSWTFKRISPASRPPNWAAFSLITEERTYDFVCYHPNIIECCVLGLQELIQRPFNRHALYKVLDFHVLSLGEFLWMRARFKLNEMATLEGVTETLMLWVILMKSALQATNVAHKIRFLARNTYILCPLWC